MRRFLLILVFVFFAKTLLAEHITGGEIFYTLTGSGGGQYQYHVTLKLYRDYYSSGAQLDLSAAIGVFDKTTNALVWNQLVPRTRVDDLFLTSPGPCISNPPTVRYLVGYYEFDITLPASPSGYTIAYQRCCRISGINNLIGSGSTGASYTAEIPGTFSGPTAPGNNSARFIGPDTVVVCGGYPFTYSFAALDTDPNDILRYSFCEAYIGGSSGNAGASAPNPPATPPYNSVDYNSPYGSSSPLGGDVSIDPNTGLMTGTAPPQGIYVVTVCVQEIRSGVVIATQRKDLQIKAGDCNIAKAKLDPVYMLCDDYTNTFSNTINSPLINTYFWDFGDLASGAENTSDLPSPAHTFSAPGDYTIKLVTNRNQECSDSTTAVVKVWPGLFPGFSTTGVCVTNPVFFHDASTTNFGTLDSWNWDFDDTGPDVSSQQNPSWTYSASGVKNVTLTVKNSKGCIKSLTKPVPIIDRPPITLAFKDTLICIPDNVQLHASGSGIFSWTPLTNITNPNTANPTVNPSSTTWYYVQLNEQGCINTDSVRIRVTSFVSLTPMADTTICLTDPVQLRVESDGLRYQWSPSATLNDPSLQNPIATPTGTTTPYHVIARIGSCTTEDDIVVTTVPYPLANAGPDTTICYNTPAYLHGSHDGSSFFWSPVSSLLHANTLHPLAYPARTGEYVLSSLDTRGCPKPGRDTVLVTVLDKILPRVTNDTMVVNGQPLQLNAEGGESYTWIPATGLNNPNISNPVGIYFESEMDSIRYFVRVFNAAGCYDSTSVKVTIFKTAPSVFVPTAFTPNGDGLNDEIKPIAAGMTRINYFRIFNRWGQLVFSTTKNGAGWDGRIRGEPQASNVYVWMVSATDYLGKPFFMKGTVTLIR